MDKAIHTDILYKVSTNNNVQDFLRISTVIYSVLLLYNLVSNYYIIMVFAGGNYINSAVCLSLPDFTILDHVWISIVLNWPHK